MRGGFGTRGIVRVHIGTRIRTVTPAVLLLSYLADRDAALLRQATLELAGEWADPVTQALLLDAAQEC
jgi:hypothetical protein